MAPSRRTLLAVFLVCASNLFLEVTLTRIFSALMFYHFSFLAIAVALLGMGTSGVRVYVSADRFTPESVERDMAQAAQWFAASTVVLLAYVLANPIAPHVTFGEAPKFTNITILQLGLLCAVSAVPFYFAGLVVSLGITHYRAHVDRIYTWDLAGAALAAALVGVVLRLLGGPALVIAVGALATIAAALLRPGRTSWGIALAMASLLLLTLTTGIFALPSSKQVRAERVVFDEWNTFSHITVENVGGGKYDIRIDSAARTPIVQPGDITAENWMVDITSFGYTMFDGGAQRAMVIGPGGGIDVARALAGGTKAVTAVEINPLIATSIMRGKFEKVSGGIFRDPRVEVVVDEGRSYVRRAPRAFDVIQISLVDTWAATASGAFALTENTLYTVEAFDDYLSHLTDGGIVTMTRWWNFLSVPETYRLTILAAAALEHRGVRAVDTRRHLYLAGHNSFANLLIKKTPFTDAELDRLDASAAKQGHRIVLSPRVTGPADLDAMLAAGAWSDKVKAYKADITPPTDDRPFFFYFVKPRDLLTLRVGSGGIVNPAAWLLGTLGAVLTVLTIGFVFAPLLLRRLDDLRGRDAGARRRRACGLGYFAAIGFAFMVVEIALMQRLSLFLGHPSYSLVVVLFAILLGTSAGARLSQRFATRPGTGAAIGAGAIAVLAVLAGLFLADVVRAWITMALPARIAVSAMIVVVFGLAMGLMLPLGVRLLSTRDAAIIPWAWGINGGMSVIGTVGATIIAISSGFGNTFFVGALIYVAAGALGFTLSRLVERAGGEVAEAVAVESASA